MKSVYNFVPAPNEREVFKPDWAHQVSHDIPFSDGQSGEIELKITAETPIFIRNGHAEGTETTEFSHLEINGEKKYFIPATSIKGMLRNVLEILSFSRMKQVDNHRHSVRQIMKTDGVIVNEGYTLSSKKSIQGNEVYEKDNIYAGYLIKRIIKEEDKYEEKYFIYSCGKPFKIRYTDLDDKFEGKFKKNFESKVSENFNERTGAYKYENVIGDKPLEYSFIKHHLEEEGQSSWKSKFQPLDYVKFSNDNNDETFLGRIVCTGQASAYNVKTARRGEYVFKGKREMVLALPESNALSVPTSVMKTFLYVNKHNKKNTEENKDWQYWKGEIDRGIPVFFRYNKDDNTVTDFGLTFMYKEPVNNTVKDLLDYNEGRDLAELIFGKIGNTDSLKGRVFVSHFFSENAKPFDSLQSEVLSSPKPSYFPNYLEQRGVNGQTELYNTYNTGGKLRGFKRYPVKSEAKNTTEATVNSNIKSTFRPLDSNTIFIGKIRYHNLRPIELGALVSAITFHSSGVAFHSLGGLKPYGYGRVKVEITGGDEPYTTYLKEFEIVMRGRNNSLWVSNLKELLFMATLQNEESQNVYPKLSDFQENKNKGRFLRKYSEMDGVTNISFKPYSTQEDITKEFERLRERENLKLTLNEEVRKYCEDGDFESAREKYHELQVIDPNFNFRKAINELGIMEEEFKQYEIVLKSDDLNVIQDFLNRYPQSDKIQEVREKELEVRRQQKAKQSEILAGEDLRFIENNFDSIKNYLNGFYKKDKKYVFSESQQNQIINRLKESYALEKENTKSDWNKNKGFAWRENTPPKYPWTDISKWLGEQKARELHANLTS